MTPHPSLSSQDLAKLLNINVSTVKRLADSGRLPCDRTPGGHRRFRLEDVRTFLAERGLCPRSLAPVIEKALSSDGADVVEQAILQRRWGALRERLISLAGAGLAHEVTELFTAAHLAGVHLSELCDHLIAPAMSEVGRKWATNDLTVADEHLISHTINLALAEMSTFWDECGDPPFTALCGCLAPDLHELGCRCVAQVLEAEGWRIAMLGAATPVEAFVSAVEKHRPNLVCLSTTVIHDAVAFATDCERIAHAARSQACAMVVGGSAVSAVEPTCDEDTTVVIRDTGGLVEYVRAAFGRRSEAGGERARDG